MVAGIAITTTARNIEPAFRDWCSHHLKVADCIFVWLDDPSEASSPNLPRDRRVRIQAGAQIRRGTVHGDLMRRQDHNVNQCLHRCTQEGLEWLVHLDTDELLYPVDRKTLETHLTACNGHVRILNHEVCPQWQCKNPFRETHYFKLNGKLHFNLYTNGKSAVRCSPGVYARDAHSFAGYDGQQKTASDMAVLHYACPSYDRWLAKYGALGEFPDFWWDDPQHRIEMSFHTRSRDICRECLADGNFARAKEFWAAQVFAHNQLEQLRHDGKVGWFAPMDRAS